jgi:hypothetical protein
MKNAGFFAAGLLLLPVSPGHAASADCPHTPQVMHPAACELPGTDERAAYERGYRNGVFVVNYAFDSYGGDCGSWDDIEALIDELKDYFGNLTGIDMVDLCRLGGITDAISDRKVELGSSDCCGTFHACADRGAVEGPQYADTYCAIAAAAEDCLDPSAYTRGPMVDECGIRFEPECEHHFARAARSDTTCFPYTTDLPPAACLEVFVDYRDYVCGWLPFYRAQMESR